MRAFLVSLLLAASAFALSVTYPSGGQGWTGATAEEQVKWVKTLGSDPGNFTIILTGPSNLLPNGPQALTAFVDASQTSGTTTVRAPSTGWPLGAGFQVQLVKSASDTTVLATSDKFEIGVKSTSSSASSTSSSSTSFIQATITPTTPNTAASSTATDALGQNNSALAALNAQYGLIPLLAMMGFALA